jgi:transposase
MVRSNLERFRALWEGLGMTETLTILRERVDDIPLVLAQLERMGVPARLDEHCPTPGNWVGLNLGGVTAIWLSHMLSQAGHRLNPVQPWAKQRLHTLRGCTGQWVPPLDVSDDRLAAVWEALRDDVRWRGLEGALTRQWLRVYDLQPERVRVDSTTASGDGAVTEDGLFQCGHSQDHRPDLPQVTVMLSALDPLGLPVATDVVPGQRADAPRYVPVLSRVRERVGQRGLLSGGDGQMGALETRAFVQAGGAYYRCPLSASQLPPARLQAYLAPVLAGDQALIPIARPQANGTQAVMAAGDEQREPLTAGVAAEPITWTERRLVLRSRQLAQASARALRGRLAKAQAALAALQERRRGKTRGTELSALREATEALRQRYQVQGLLAVRDTEAVCEHPVRRYGNRPATVRVERAVRMTAVVNQEALTQAVRRLGWRV